MRNQRALGHRHLRRGLGGEDLWSIPVTARSARPRSVSKVITQAQPTPCRRGEPSKRSLLRRQRLVRGKKVCTLMLIPD